MKAEIILTIVWTSLCISERQQRSTVLTDESKRVVEHFDFSNFDKQEALNYLDRQRFENQIRGKRSHTNIKRNTKHIKPNIHSESEIEPFRKSKEKNIELKSPKIKILENAQYESPALLHESGCKLTVTSIPSRNRRGHRLKKKSKKKTSYGFEESNNINVKKEHKSRRKKKKTKKNRKKKRDYWEKWSEWSPCSVTCGRGRKIRWRRCIVKNCTTGELEMGEKTCQLPACNLLTKLLGL